MHLLLALVAAVQQLIPSQSLSATARMAVVTDAQGRDSTLLRVLAINDFHGALEPQVWPWSGGRQVGGAPALKPWLDSLARACLCTSLRLDAGDEMQGTPVSNFNYGRPAIAALDALGIDAAAIGNHEFDWSVDTLRARMADAHYRFLAANITDTTGLARPDWALPFTVIERGGTRIAVIGLALPETPETTTPKNVQGLAFRDPVAAVKRVLPQARAAADYVIVVAHIGAFCDADSSAASVPAGPTACRGEIIDLARGLDSGSVDLIVSGHTHSLVKHGRQRDSDRPGPVIRRRDRRGGLRPRCGPPRSARTDRDAFQRSGQSRPRAGGRDPHG